MLNWAHGVMSCFRCSFYLHLLQMCKPIITNTTQFSQICCKVTAFYCLIRMFTWKKVKKARLFHSSFDWHGIIIARFQLLRRGPVCSRTLINNNPVTTEPMRIQVRTFCPSLKLKGSLLAQRLINSVALSHVFLWFRNGDAIINWCWNIFTPFPNVPFRPSKRPISARETARLAS